MPELLAHARRLLAPQADEQALLDLYFGYGLFSHALAPAYARVLGVDAGGPAIRAAAANTQLNPCAVPRRFLAARIDRALVDRGLRRQGRETILLDPPRQGTQPGVIAALAQRRERYRSLIELAPDGVLVSSGGIIEYANQAAARILKAGSPRRLVGTTAEALVHPEHLERHRERMAYLQTGPGATAFEERKLRGADGAELVVEAGSVSYLERGRLVTQSVLRDVGEQRKARQALAEREQRFRDVVEASGEYVWETDAGWRYTYLSERVESVLGYLRHEMLGRTPRDFMPLGEAQSAAEWFAQHAARGEAFRDLVQRSLTKSGRVIWQSVSGVPVHDAEGRLTGYRGTGADITARKQAEVVEGLPAAIILVPDVRPLNPKMALAGMQLSIRRSDDPG